MKPSGFQIPLVETLLESGLCASRCKSRASGRLLGSNSLSRDSIGNQTAEYIYMRRMACCLGIVPPLSPFGELELELIQTQMTQKPMLRAEVYMPSIITLVQLLFFKGSPRYSDACDSGEPLKKSS